MSHITTADGIEIRDLKALKEACDSCGVTFDDTKKTFVTYGGQRAKCDAVIEHPKARYQIGVVSKPDGTYELQVDNWDGMGGLAKYVGRDAGTLLQHYTSHVARRQLRREGWRVKTKTDENGCMQLVATR